MSEIDPRTLQLYSEEDLLMNDVVKDDAELLFLDTYLTDLFKSYREHWTAAESDSLIDAAPRCECDNNE